LFGSLKRRGRKGFGGGKYRGKWRNLPKFKRVFFLKNDKLMLMINIFFIFKNNPPPKTLPSQCSLFFALAPSFFPKSSPPFPS